MEVKVRLAEEDRVRLLALAGMQGKTFAQVIREAAQMWVAAQYDGVSRVGGYWVVPQGKMALVYSLPYEEGPDVVRK